MENLLEGIAPFRHWYINPNEKSTQLVIDRRVGSGRFGQTVLTNSGFSWFWQTISELRTIWWPLFFHFWELCFHKIQLWKYNLFNNCLDSWSHKEKMGHLNIRFQKFFARTDQTHCLSERFGRTDPNRRVGRSLIRSPSLIVTALE